MQVSFAGSKSIATFEVPISHIAVQSFDFTANRLKAGPFSVISDDSRYGSLATFRKGLASFVIYIHQVFGPMPNSSKTCSKAAQNVSASTASPRQKAYSTLKSEEGQSAKHLISRATEAAFSDCDRILAERAKAAKIYRVEIHALGTWAKDYKSGIYHADNYTASNEEEAIGMAIRHVTNRFACHAAILSDIKCSLLNAASAL